MRPPLFFLDLLNIKNASAAYAICLVQKIKYLVLIY